MGRGGGSHGEEATAAADHSEAVRAEDSAEAAEGADPVSEAPALEDRDSAGQASAECLPADRREDISASDRSFPVPAAGEVPAEAADVLSPYSFSSSCSASLVFWYKTAAPGRIRRSLYPGHSGQP